VSEILIAPLAHNPLRDWPAAHYASLIGLLLDRIQQDVRITVVGTANQRHILNEIVRSFPADRVFNAGGSAWDEVVGRIRSAACVIGNNSGIAHLGGLFGVPTICIFGGSHQRTEWAPLRPNVTVLSREIGCSPCQFHDPRDCHYGIACLGEILPQSVADATLEAIRLAAIAQDVMRAPPPKRRARKAA